MSTDRLQSHATGAAKPARRLAFSTPMGVSATAVLAIAIIAAAILLGPRGLFGLGSGPSPTPLPSLEPTASFAATPTVGPTPTAEPTPTRELAWIGLDWSEPILLSSAHDPTFRVTDSLWWDGRYVGTGYVIRGVDPQTGVVTSPSGGINRIPLFLESPDGVNWDVVQEMEAFLDGQGDSYAHPVRVVPAGDRLVAWSGYLWGGGPRTLWQSDDGQSWATIDSPSWREGWTGRAKAIAGGASGVVAIGAEGPGCCMNPDGPGIIGHSTDGVVWTWLSDSPEFAHASFTDVAATRDGFVLVGWIGETEAEARERDRSGEAEPLGRPAAWTSTDGVSWVPSDVEGPEIEGGRLARVLVSSDGLFATGMAAPHEHWWEPTTGWASVDGRAWSLIGTLGGDLPSVSVMASDGQRMVILGPESSATSTLAGWTSTDGSTWTRLVFSGAPAPAVDLPNGAVGESGALRSDVGDMLPSTRLLRDGLVAYGGMPDAGAAAWVATAIER
jgi:hypothetical protein